MKKVLNAVIVLVFSAAIVTGCIFAYRYFTKDPPQENNNEDNSEGDKVNENIKHDPIFTVAEYPKADGSTATIPLSQAFKRVFTGDASADVEHATTHFAYLNLINGESDIILATYPSEEELQTAKETGVELEIEPVVNEAFVFYVNEKNPVKNLTLEQIRKIYSGEITNWSEVGGDNAPITAYQREPNSGSQSGMIDLVMKDVPLMEPPKENIIQGMAAIIGLVSDYDNGKYSIGYSYYYYATTMYDDIDKAVADRIRFVAVNGVEPNSETIIDGSYPIRTAYYVVINKAEEADSPVRALKDAMLSAWGQQTAKEAGYVPLYK